MMEKLNFQTPNELSPKGQDAPEKQRVSFEQVESFLTQQTDQETAAKMGKVKAFGLTALALFGSLMAEGCSIKIETASPEKSTAAITKQDAKKELLKLKKQIEDLDKKLSQEEKGGVTRSTRDLEPSKSATEELRENKELQEDLAKVRKIIADNVQKIFAGRPPDEFLKKLAWKAQNGYPNANDPGWKLRKVFSLKTQAGFDRENFIFYLGQDYGRAVVPADDLKTVLAWQKEYEDYAENQDSKKNLLFGKEGYYLIHKLQQGGMLKESKIPVEGAGGRLLSDAEKDIDKRMADYKLKNIPKFTGMDLGAFDLDVFEHKGIPQEMDLLKRHIEKQKKGDARDQKIKKVDRLKRGLLEEWYKEHQEKNGKQ